MKHISKYILKILYICVLMLAPFTIYSVNACPYYTIIHKDIEKKSKDDNNTYGVVVQRFDRHGQRRKSQELLIKGYDKRRELRSSRTMIFDCDSDYEHVKDLVNMGRILSNIEFKLKPEGFSVYDEYEDHEIMYLGKERSVSKSDIILGLEDAFEIKYEQESEE